MRQAAPSSQTSGRRLYRQHLQRIFAVHNAFVNLCAFL
jgi:hypothetical protein